MQAIRSEPINVSPFRRGSKRGLYEIVWRLAILALPWQARWFWDAQIVGWPWEQGRISFYVSWLPLLLTIVLGFFQTKKDLPLKFRRNIFWLVAALGVCSVLAMPSPNTAAIQWWVQVMILVTFFITLIRTDVSVRKIAFWFVISLIPHALLAIWQFATQTVIGSSWLGMSSQNPADLGVSVVQTASGRFLRAYGGFPHPNILGGWMAVGLLVTLTLFSSPFLLFGGRKGRGIEGAAMVWGIEGLFTLALFYSFSRSAWLAVAIGLAIFSLLSFSRMRESSKKNINKSNGSPPSALNLRGDDNKRWLSLAIPLILFVALTIVHRDLVLTRADVQNSRLEQISVTSRIQSLKNGVDVFRSRLLFGTGPNSELPVLASLKKITTSPTPLEPPHMVWLLILANFGIAGSLFIFGFGIYLLRSILNKWRLLDTHNKILLVTLVTCQLILVSLDHYPWSLWSGQTLSALVIFVILSAVEGSGPKLDAKHNPQLLTDGQK